jgi:hypothetical protein
MTGFQHRDKTVGRREVEEKVKTCKNGIADEERIPSINQNAENIVQLELFV